MKCKNCFKDLDEEKFRFYIKSKDAWFCYECYEKEKKEMALILKEEKWGKITKIRQLYKQKYKPSEIARTLDISAREVYEALTEGENDVNNK